MTSLPAGVPNSLVKSVQNTLDLAYRLSYITRAKELQLEAIGALKSVGDEVHRAKMNFIDAGAEDAANYLLSQESLITAALHELRMWVGLKEDKPDEAWDDLIYAQSALRNAMRAHTQCADLGEHVEYLESLEQVIFPPQVFMSVGMFIDHSICSICGAEYGECVHLQGRPYMGKLCSRIIDKAIALEVSFVDHPANKHCRVQTLTVDGENRDLLTWRVVTEPMSQGIPHDGLEGRVEVTPNS
jgi:hypothetical protein